MGDATNTVTDADEMSKFEGFSAKDGVRQDPATTEPPKDQEQNPKPASDPKAAAQATEGDEDENEEAEAAGADDDAKKHASAQERINKAVGKQRAAERRAEAAEQRTLALERRLAAIEASLTPKPAQAKSAATDAPPDPSAYKGGEFDSQYIRDLARYEALQATKTLRAETEQSAAERQRAAEAAAVAEKIQTFTDAATETYEDFAEVVFADHNQISQVLVDLCLESDHGAQIAYELALDPKEQRRLVALTPAQQAAWFGRREAALISSQDGDAGQDAANKGGQAAPKQSKAPPPPSHQSKGNGGQATVSASTPNFSDFERMAMGAKS